MLDETVVATTVKAADDAIVEWCKKNSQCYYRGSEEDVLDRYYHAAREYHADVVVRITSDCPLIDSEVIEWNIREFLDRQPDIDYVSNTFPERTFPRGLDTEVMGYQVLERVWGKDKNPSWREHVTLYIRRNPEAFNIYGVNNEEDLSGMRWTVDAPEDFELARRIYNHFPDDSFSWKQVIELLDRHPEWLDINKNIEQKRIR
jgi:spore coat polysaccharide biosynthesis protein SpsF